MWLSFSHAFLPARQPARSPAQPAACRPEILPPRRRERKRKWARIRTLFFLELPTAAATTASFPSPSFLLLVFLPSSPTFALLPTLSCGKLCPTKAMMTTMTTMTTTTITTGRRRRRRRRRGCGARDRFLIAMANEKNTKLSGSVTVYASSPRRPFVPFLSCSLATRDQCPSS